MVRQRQWDLEILKNDCLLSTEGKLYYFYTKSYIKSNQIMFDQNDTGSTVCRREIIIFRLFILAKAFTDNRQAISG